MSANFSFHHSSYSRKPRNHYSLKDRFVFILAFFTGWRPNGSSDEAKVFGAVRRGLSETVDCRVFNFFVVKCYSSTQDSVLKKERIIDLPPKHDDSFSTWLDLAILRLCILSPKIAVFGTLVVWWHEPKTHSNYSPSVRPIYKHLPILPGECCRQILRHREIVLTLFFIPGKQRSLDDCDVIRKSECGSPTAFRRQPESDRRRPGIKNIVTTNSRSLKIRHRHSPRRNGRCLYMRIGPMSPHHERAINLDLGR